MRNRIPRGRRPNIPGTQRMVFNVVFLLALLVGILVYKHYGGERVAEFMGAFGAGSGSGTGSGAGASETSSLTFDVAHQLVGQSIETAQEATRGGGPL